MFLSDTAYSCVSFAAERVCEVVRKPSGGGDPRKEPHKDSLHFHLQLLQLLLPDIHNTHDVSWNTANTHNAWTVHYRSLQKMDETHRTV